MSAGWQIGWYNGWSPQERMATLPAQREAIRSGTLKKPSTCSICGVTPSTRSDNPVWLHDENYAEPLLAYHVCRACHRALHDRFEQPDAWLALVRTHGDGGRWFEALSMDAASLRQPFEMTYPNGLPHA
jgi:hypothetical protein